MSETRIKLNMSTQDAVMALAEGNPGAMTVCMTLLREGAAIDPDAAFGGLANLLSLDTLNVYASRIWMFYKDFCKESIPNMIAVIRANQLGQLAGVTEEKLNHAIDNYGEGLNLEDIMEAVQKELPLFNKAAEAA
jgi:hypothetical protein